MVGNSRSVYHIIDIVIFAVYHMKCIDPWLTKNRRVCPVCKGKVVLPGMSDVSETESETEPPAPSERTPLIPNNRAPRRQRRQRHQARPGRSRTNAGDTSNRRRSDSMPAVIDAATSTQSINSNSGSSTHLVSAEITPVVLPPTGHMSVNFGGDNEPLSDVDSEVDIERPANQEPPQLGQHNRLLNMATSVRRQRRQDVIV